MNRKGIEWAAAISDDPRATVTQAKHHDPDDLVVVQGESFPCQTKIIDGEIYIKWEDAKRYAEWRVQQTLKHQQRLGITLLPERI